MFPEPDTFLQRHSQTLIQLIHDAIREQGGWISFDRYMQMALYQPGLGYYTAGSERFGPQGDFVTAPTLGRLFAASLASQCKQVLALDGCDTIVEFGAGNGDLAANILLELAQSENSPGRYQIVETSPDLIARQQQRIAQLGNEHGDALIAGVEWLSTLPQAINGVVIANEVVDAMPFKRFELVAEDQAQEIGVIASQDGLRWSLGQEFSLPFSLPDCTSGYQSEWSPRSEAWVRSVGERLKKGVMLLIDYGFPEHEFYHPDRQQGTLMCHYRHHAHSDPFYWPGLQDITCHVNFSAVAQAGLDVGLELIGYNSQGEFLLACGLLNHMERQISEVASLPQEQQTRRQMEMSAEVKKLTLPHEMGELFKVIALGRNVNQALSGFRSANKSYRLLND